MTGTATGQRDRPRLAVVADRYLIGDTARMALSSRGFRVINAQAPIGAVQLAEAERTLRRFRPDLGVLLTDVEDPAQRRDAAALVARVPARWLLLTTATSRAAHGAVLAAGAVGVRPMSVRLDELTRVLTEMQAGRPVMAATARQQAIQAWYEVAEEQQRLVKQMEQLTPREMAVLGRLYDGLTVRVIAEETGVSEGTVRSHVKSILRKLKVSSQLAAVAAYRQICEQVARGRSDE